MEQDFSHPTNPGRSISVKIFIASITLTQKAFSYSSWFSFIIAQ